MDQPIGTGFSYSSDRRDIRHNEDEISNDLYDFLQVRLFILEEEFSIIVYSLLNYFLSIL